MARPDRPRKSNSPGRSKLHADGHEHRPSQPPHLVTIIRLEGPLRGVLTITGVPGALGVAASSTKWHECAGRSGNGQLSTEQARQNDDMSEPTPEDRRHSAEEAGELVRRATELNQDDDGLTYEELIKVAGEVGIDKRSVDEALRQAEAEEAERLVRANTPPAWRSVTDRCLEILCLKPVRRA